MTKCALTPNFGDIQGGHAGTGNLNQDPSFVIDGNFHLQSGSPCIDTGSNAAVPADAYDVDGDGDTSEPTPDLDKTARIVDGPDNDNPPVATVDMGTYEYAPGP